MTKKVERLTKRPRIAEMIIAITDAVVYSNLHITSILFKCLRAIKQSILADCRSSIFSKALP